MAPLKRICLTGKTCSVGKVQKSLCYGQSELHSGELDVQRKGRETCTSCCCAEFSINSRNQQIRSKTLRRTHKPGTRRRGNPEENRSQDRTQRRRRVPEQQSCLLHIPNFVPSSRIQSFTGYNFLARTKDDLCSIDFIGLTLTRPSRVENQSQIEGIDSPA